MTNLSQETLLGHIEEELPRSERYYKENQLWKDGQVSKVLSVSLRRCRIRIKLISLSFLAYFYLLVTYPPEHDNRTSVVVPAMLVLLYFLPKLRSHQRLEVLSELWDELAESDGTTTPEESHTENALHG